MAESSFRIPHVLSEGQLDPNFQEGRLRRPTPDKRELDQWVKELERKVARDRMRDKLRHMREAVHRRSQEMWTRRIYQETQKKKQKERQGAQLTGPEERGMEMGKAAEEERHLRQMEEEVRDWEKLLREKIMEEEMAIREMEEKVREQETMLKEKVKEKERELREMMEKVREKERKLREEAKEEERHIRDMEEKVREQETMLKEKVEDERQIREMEEKVKE
ncbi:golgin subfamily A member 6-like protein 6 isoform X2 [Alosa alosa]|uniref:golgin subfamily A member 6-like protein 6 isoform X2 n=1 Tax=Alosa alosa TaxID=278164 RepID=UPI0020150BE0|nr:golgin subfamily A member 6-like protein 6 isoform X2 [Alosa alosa]